MKNNLLLWMNGLFLLLLGIISCSSDDEETIPEISGTIIEKVDCSKAVSDFMDQFCEASQTDIYLSNEPHKTCVINSKEEKLNYNYTKILLLSEDQLPDIDFSKYSLVIGYYQHVNRIGAKVPIEKKKQTLYDSNDGYILELQYTYQKIKENHVITCDAYYIINWGLYPKLNGNKDIKTQMTFIR